MKAKLKKEYTYEIGCSSATSIYKTVKVGDEVEIRSTEIFKDPGETPCHLCVMPNGTQQLVPCSWLEITDCAPVIDWEQRRFEIIKANLAARQADLANRLREEGKSLYHSEYEDLKRRICQGAVDLAMYMADMLIAKLKVQGNVNQ